MAEGLEDLLRACTVRVSGGQEPATGFFIAPGKILTCLHFIGDSPGLTIRWDRDGQPPAQVPVTGRAVLSDLNIAVLEIGGLADHPCVRIDAEWPVEQDRLVALWYPRQGAALTSVQLTYRGPYGAAPTAFLDLDTDIVDSGMTGAAVLNLRTGGVCGVLTAGQHSGALHGALAIPMPAIVGDLGDVLTANGAYHDHDLRWDTAAATRTEPAARGEDDPAGPGAVRVFISYAHDDETHVKRVQDFWVFLRSQGIDARLDLPAEEQRLNWAQWMTREIRDADHVLVIASPQYKRRAEGDAGPDEGRGVQWEATVIQEVFYAEQQAGLQRILPVVLPSCSATDIPLWLSPASATHYDIHDYTIRGAERLLRLLTRQPWETMPPLGTVPVLPSRAPEVPVATAEQPGLHTEVVIETTLSDSGVLDSAVHVAGSVLCHRQATLPAEVTGVWKALDLPGLIAGDRMADAGRKLAQTLLDDASQELLAGLLDRLPAGGTAEITLLADGPALSLPIELVRLATGGNAEIGPLGLVPGVSIMRRPAVFPMVLGGRLASVSVPEATAGPLKVLAAIATPDETKTANPPLDVEAEMAAVLDAVTDVAAGPHAQVRILEVASLPAIRQALSEDAYHVLHLSAHGSPDLVELEDEDGSPVAVTPVELMQALKRAGRPVPLIMLSSCSGGATGTAAMAAGLITHGADRVVAMLASVTDTYATRLARHFYSELSSHPALAVGQALAQARYLSEDNKPKNDARQLPAPEYGIATLLAASGDGPLVDQEAQARPLTVMTSQPGGRLARDLPMGALIGRRAQLRDAMGILRRRPEAVTRFGAANGVQLTGIGGIGKTALAGRVISRLRDDGWLIAIHEGRWNPTSLIWSTAQAITDTLPRTGDLARVAALRGFLDRLTESGDDGPKLAAIADILATQQLLLVFDDFEQNLTAGGGAFLDSSVDEVITSLADTAGKGALLITCRYPLPGPERFLVQIPIPALSSAELRRLFLRLPAVNGLNPEDKRLLTRTIGGHPRLIEFTDALLRGGRADLMHVQVKLRDLARAEGLDLAKDPSPEQALNQAMLLGSANILLTELLTLLTPRQQTILLQIAVCRAPMTPDDLAYALAYTESDTDASADGKVLPAELRHDVDRLTDMTLLMPGKEIAMHPWTAELVTGTVAADLDARHQRALAMRLRRFSQNRGSYEDLIDIPGHLSALRRYDDIATVAEQAIGMLPGTLATVAYLAEIRPQIPETEWAWILIADLEAQALLRVGDLPAATRQLQAIHEQIQARAAKDPTNAELQRNLSVMRNRLGDVAVDAGDLTAARTAYQAGLDIRQRLIAADPANSGWQRDLSVSHDRLGNVAVDAGDLTAARTAYQASLDIRLGLAAADPANTEWQRDLSVSHEKLGDVAVAAGDLTTARTAYQASLDIRLGLAAADPANTEWQRDLSVSHNKLGDVAVAAGDLTAARTAYQAGLDIAQRLAAADPANTGWQRDLSVSHNRLGDLAVAAGDLTAARTAYQAGLDIAQRLAAADPANSGWQRDLSVSHDRLGDVAVAAGDLTAARTAYQAGLDIRLLLAAADPANTEWQRNLSVSHNKLGDVAVAAGDLTAARTAYQAGLDIAQRLAAADPANTGWQRNLSVSHNRLGDVAVAAGDLTAARTAYQASLDIAQRLAAADPANTQWQRDLSVSHNKLGDVAVAAGDLTAARTAYQASLDIAQRLAAADPANTQWQRDLQIVRQQIEDLSASA